MHMATSCLEALYAGESKPGRICPGTSLYVHLHNQKGKRPICAEPESETHSVTMSVPALFMASKAPAKNIGLT